MFSGMWDITQKPEPIFIKHLSRECVQSAPNSQSDAYLFPLLCLGIKAVINFHNI